MAKTEPPPPRGSRRLRAPLTQRGIALIHAAIGVAVLGIIAGVFFVAINYVKGVDKKAYDRGVRETESVYKSRDNQQLRVLEDERSRLLTQVGDLERARDNAIAKKEEEHARKTAQQQAEFDSFIADINAGRVVWRDPGAPGPGAACADRSAAAAPAADPRAGDGSDAGRGLSAEAERFLVSEANRANAIIGKLNLCRGVLEEIYASR